MGKDKNGFYILRASFTDKNGIKHYARTYGKRCFKIYISKQIESILAITKSFRMRKSIKERFSGLFFFINKKLPHRNVSCTSKCCESIDIIMAGDIGLAPMAFCLTGKRSN